MNTPAGFRILLRGPDEADVRKPLEQAGHNVDGLSVRTDGPAHYHLIIDDNRLAVDMTAAEAPRLRGAGNAGDTPVLGLVSDSLTPTRLARFAAGAHAILVRPFTSEELLAQVNSLLGLKERLDDLSDKASELQVANQRLHLSHQRVNQELELARRIQLSFLPQTLPEVPGVSFAVHYRPCGRVGGDFYDVFRLDEQHVGFYVADAMGHGVPASLLTMFLKRGVRAKDIYQGQYRLVPPDEVLERLNRDLLEQGIVEDSFITMVYALMNVQERILRFSRAGHPHPVHIPADRPAQLLEAPGSLLGVFETQFTERVCKLVPGDKALFYTDGTDAIAFEDQAPGTESFLACVNSHRNRPIAELVDRLSHDLCHRAEQPDDFTLFGLEVTG